MRTSLLQHQPLPIRTKAVDRCLTLAVEYLLQLSTTTGHPSLLVHKCLILIFGFFDSHAPTPGHTNAFESFNTALLDQHNHARPHATSFPTRNDSRILALHGKTFIAPVFRNGKRWTVVTLFLPRNFPQNTSFLTNQTACSRAKAVYRLAEAVSCQIKLGIWTYKYIKYFTNQFSTKTAFQLRS